MNEPIDLGSMQIDLERIMPNLRWTKSVASNPPTTPKPSKGASPEKVRETNDK